MSNSAWRRRIWIWVAPLTLCLVNLVAYLFYSNSISGTVEGLENRYEERQAQLQRLFDDRDKLLAFLQRVEDIRDGSRQLIEVSFATEAERFTEVTRHVRDLVGQAGFELTRVQYPQESLDELNLIQREIKFNVEGTYDNLRKLINFLELTDQFVTLDAVSLDGDSVDGTTARLRISLSLSTVFAAEGDRR